MFLCSSEQCLKYSTVLLYTGSFPLTSAALSISDTAYLLYQGFMHHYSNSLNRGCLGMWQCAWGALHTGKVARFTQVHIYVISHQDVSHY